MLYLITLKVCRFTSRIRNYQVPLPALPKAAAGHFNDLLPFRPNAFALAVSQLLVRKAFFSRRRASMTSWLGMLRITCPDVAMSKIDVAIV